MSALTIFMAAPARAAECPPDRPLCRLFATPTTAPLAAPVVTIPPSPPVTIAPPPPPAPAAPRTAPEAAQRLLDLVNGERAKAGLGRLTSRDDVVTIALAHSQRMVAAGTIFHNDSYFTDSVRRQLNSQARGENVAQNTSVDDTHVRLMNSPGHRANILDPRFTVAGFAVVQATDGRYFTTQNFLQPAGAVATTAAPAPRPSAAPAVARPPVAVAAPAVTAGPPAVGEVPGTAPATAVEPPEVTKMPGRTLAGLASGHRAPAASAGPGLPGRSSQRTWLPAVILLGLVGLGLVQVSRRAPRRFSAIH
ncbi:MAG TPA: CAP domain-containing protein [Acidimicrobiales bacterium]|nr:CAP domain-containing protein [Acidimicrobiales bacterium]